jgi:hypothetical protein
MHWRNYECKQNFRLETSSERPVNRIMHRWEDNMKVEVTKIRCEYVSWNCDRAESSGGLLWSWY